MENREKEFILSYQVGVEVQKYDHNRLIQRMNNYNFGFWYRKLLHVSFRTFVSNLKPFRREFPKNLYFGSQWFNITHEAVKYIFEYLEENPDYLKRFEYTWGSDEVFFNSILRNSEHFKSKIVNDVLRYMVWSGGVPNTLLIKDYELLKQSHALFARKFDENVDNEIIDKLYNDIS